MEAQDGQSLGPWVTVWKDASWTPVLNCYLTGDKHLLCSAAEDLGLFIVASAVTYT